MNEIILSRLGFALSLTIHANTAKNYLKELEYVYTKVKKKMYIDRLEKEDVIAYQKVFLEWINELEDTMPIFSENNLEKITWPDNNMQPLILITHDECIFLAYDRSQSLWIPNKE